VIVPKAVRPVVDTISDNAANAGIVMGGHSGSVV
jgi:2-keto-4-pentenoate hydratase